MIFPHNIDRIIKVSKKNTPKQYFNVFLFLLIAVSLVAFFWIRTLLGGGVFLSLVIILVIAVFDIVVCTTVFRVFVIKEDDKVRESENSKSDSLANYYQIRERENNKVINGVEVFENTDGNHLVCIQLFYGPNDRVKAQKTLIFFGTLFNKLSKYCIDFRVYVGKENFRESEECKVFLHGVNNSKGSLKLSKAMLEISDLVLNFTEEKGELYSTYILIRMTPFQLNTINVFMNELSALFSSSEHSIRSYKFLDKKKFRDFIRDYNNLEALDLSNLRNSNTTEEMMRKYGKLIYRYEDKSSYRFGTGVKKL